MSSPLARLSVLAFSLFLINPSARAATSVTYFGITWYFGSDRPTGTFANGEPYVVGPVTITNIDPNPSQSTYNVQNGSMINPIPNTDHGFDSNAGVSPLKYDATKNVARSFPFNLKVGDVLVSAKSQAYYPTWIKTYAALTVLASIPPSGSFRPSLYGPDRTVKFNVSQINWSVLKNFAATPSTPSKEVIAGETPALPWFEWMPQWNGNSLQGDDNTADGPVVDGTHWRVYGRDTGAKFGEIALWLNTNQPLSEKTPIAIQMIQNGIDIHYYLQNGGGYYHDGGHKCGRKLPLVMAALMLNDASLKTMASNPDLFQEDQQTFIVTQADVGRVLWVAPPGDSWYGREFLQYTQADVGKGDWGIRHRFEPFYDNASLNSTYRSTVYMGMMSSWLAATLMGAQTLWNHPAAFANMEIVKGYAGYAGASTARTAFNNEMAAYRNGGPQVPPTPMVEMPIASPAGGQFANATSVTLSTLTTGATIRYTLDGSTPNASSAIYKTPLTISATTTLKAIAFKASLSESGVANATYIIGSDLVSSNAFLNLSISSQSGAFVLSFDTLPLASNIDALSGLSLGSADAFSDLAVAVRFNVNGLVDARNGSTYAADNSLNYVSGETFHVEMSVNLLSHTYDVDVTKSGGSRVRIATGYAFRSEQSGVASLDNFNLIAVNGSHIVKNLQVSAGTSNPLSAPKKLHIVRKGK